MNNHSQGDPLNNQEQHDELAVYLKKFWYWFIISVIGFLLAAAAYQWLHQPIFNVSAVIKVNDMKNSQDISNRFLLGISDSKLQRFNKTVRSGILLKKMEQQIDPGLLDEELSDLQIITGNTPDTIELSINTSRPQQASLFLNSLYFVYENENKKAAALLDYNAGLDSLSRIIANQNKTGNRLKNKIRHSDGVKQTPEQTLEAKKQLDILKTFKPYLRHADRQFQLIPTTFPVTDLYINHLVSQFNDAQNDKQSLLSDNPDQTVIAAANQKISGIQNLLIAAIDSANVKISLKSNYGNFTVNDKTIRDSLAKLKQAIEENISKYAALLTKKRIGQSLAFAGGNARSPLAISVVPVSGNIFGLYLIALLSGILLPLATIYFFALYVPNAFADDKDAVTGIPVLGDISSPDGSIKLAAEINHLLAPKGRKIILITSDNVYNKHLTSLGIGLSLIRQQDKVVIIDLDFDINTVINDNLRIQPGIIDFLTGGTAALTEIIMTMPHPSISTIGRGQALPNEDTRDTILGSAKLDWLMDQLAVEFNYIVLNTSSMNHPENVLPLTNISDINLVIVNNRSSNGTASPVLNKLVVKHCIKDIYIIKNQ